jgi:hypothetical protein
LGAFGTAAVLLFLLAARLHSLYGLGGSGGQDAVTSSAAHSEETPTTRLLRVETRDDWTAVDADATMASMMLPAAETGPGLPLPRGPCPQHGLQYLDRNCYAARSAAATYGYPKTTYYKSFLADAADYCTYLVAGGHLIAAGSPDLVHALFPRLVGWSPDGGQVPFILLGGTGVYLSNDNFFVYDKSTGLVGPASPDLHNETNTDVLCQSRAPDPCAALGETYVNYVADDGSGAVGPPGCVALAGGGGTSSRAAARAGCGPGRHLVAFHTPRAGELLASALGPFAALWTGFSVSPVTTLADVPLLYVVEGAPGYFVGPLFNETNVVAEVAAGGGTVDDIGVVWDPVVGLRAVATVGGQASVGYGVGCQLDIPVRILPDDMGAPGATNRGQLVAYLPGPTFGNVPRRVCPVRFGHMGGMAVCRQLGYDTGRAYEPIMNTRDELAANDTACVGQACTQRDVDVLGCAGNILRTACCASPEAVFVDCSMQ